MWRKIENVKSIIEKLSTENKKYVIAVTNALLFHRKIASHAIPQSRQRDNPRSIISNRHLKKGHQERSKSWERKLNYYKLKNLLFVQIANVHFQKKRIKN